MYHITNIMIRYKNIGTVLYNWLNIRMSNFLKKRELYLFYVAEVYDALPTQTVMPMNINVHVKKPMVFHTFNFVLRVLVDS